MSEFSGKVAIITGGAMGMGKACATATWWKRRRKQEGKKAKRKG